jgi:hypothetical protein
MHNKNFSDSSLGKKEKSAHKNELRKHVTVCILLSLAIVLGGFIFTLPVASAQFREFDSDKTVTITTEDGKKFTFGQDFDIEVDRPQSTAKDSDAKTAKNLKIERGETMNVEIKGGLREETRLCLVDKDKSDNSIAKDISESGSAFICRTQDGIEIEEIVCLTSNPPRACETGEFEVEIPDDIDKGKYKLLVGTFIEESLHLYINEVKVR